jgi:type I restriction enzyme M protein
MVKLGDVCDIYNGSTPKRNEPTYWENGSIPWFTIDDVRNQGRIIKDTIQKITEEGYKNSSVKLLPKNSVLLCCTASVGEYAYTEIELTTNQQFNGIVVNTDYKNKLEPKFIFCLAPTFKKELERLSGKTSFNFVSVGTLKSIKIPLPPLNIQQEIVSEIEGYQKIIDGARQVVSNYKPQIKIDPEWPVVELGEISKPQYGFTTTGKDHGDARLIRITDIGSDGKLIPDDAKYLVLDSESKAYLLKRGDILVARTGATFGKTMMFKEDYPAVFASFLIRLNFINPNSILPEYYWSFSQSEGYWKQANLLMTGGGQPQFNGNALVKIKIPVPNIDIQQQIVAQIEKEQQLVDANKQLIQIYEQKIKSKIAEVWET